MKIVLPGGSGQVGRMLVRSLTCQGHTCVVLTRRPGSHAAYPLVREVAWDGRTKGAWFAEIDGADAVINLTGRTVDCRYTRKNLAQMFASRLDSTRIVGEAIATAAQPPRVWLQAGTATIYSHRFDASNDELTGQIGGHEPGVPALWQRSIELALAWEAELAAAMTPQTRKVMLCTSITMSPDRGGVFQVLAQLCRLGAGRQGDGRQFVSWIHEYDFTAAVDLLLARDDLSGAINLCSPNPLPNREFMAALHRAVGAPVAVPLPCWLLEIGAIFIRTETELILKSRHVVPTRLLQAGFTFRYPDLDAAALELACRKA